MSTAQPKIPHRPPRTPDRNLVVGASGSRPPRTTPNKKWPAVFAAQQQQLHQMQMQHPGHHSPQHHDAAAPGHPQLPPQQQQLPHHHHNTIDNRSRGSAASASDSHATPTSVLLRAGSPLTRDLSDLSGSYMGGLPPHRHGTHHPHGHAGGSRSPSPHHGGGVPVHVYPSDQSDTSYQRPWRHAYVLSERGTVHPQPKPDAGDESSSSLPEAHHRNNNNNNNHGPSVTTTTQIDLFRKSRVMVGPQGLVEVVAYRSDDTDSMDSVFNGSSGSRTAAQPRIPLLILLMDPHRKIYELEQLWIDTETDTVRDVLHAVQLSLSDRWRQDYDGLFQVRNRTFNQLIHILNVEKYGVLPLEVWVAKPWAMPAKATIQYANSLLHHLVQRGALSYVPAKDYPHWEKYYKHGTPPPHHHAAEAAKEVVLTCTPDAARRINVPGGTVLRHHHAHQFLSFSPPLEHETKGGGGGVQVHPHDDSESLISDMHTASVGGSSFGDSTDRAASPASSSRSPEDAEVSVIHQVSAMPPLSKHSPVSKGDAPLIQRPRPVAHVSPAVPHVTTAARLASRRQKEQAVDAPSKAAPPQSSSSSQRARHRLAQLFCCRSKGAAVVDNDDGAGLRRNPTLETVTEWKPYWEEVGSVGSASGISDSRPLLLHASPTLHISGRSNPRTRSDWC